MVLEFEHVCNQLLKSHNRIFIASVLRGVELLAQAKKGGMPLPDSEQMEKLYLQGMTMLTQVSTNEPLYGKVEYIVISHEKIKAVLLPIDQEHYLGIACSKPCDADIVIKNAKRIILEATT